ncbi:MAG: glycerophosphodiester phosphodiesterase family protein [Acutalibacteraceae bacterium]|nr:glycerophosphodiester phosphodiesterase family protein [Acutalibacteraceae bacterium]
MKKSLIEKADENIIVVAHRGTSGGNIPCNTMAAYEIALKQGADMIEVDVSCSRDGKLFLFHPGMEREHLNKCTNLKLMKYENITKLHYSNYDRTPTQFTIAGFDDFLEQFKDRCFINIDKFWDNPEKIYECIKRHGMTEQMLVKSKPSKKVFEVLRQLCPELPYIPIVSEKHPMHKELMDMGINYIGAEVLFKKDDSYIASDEFIDMMHRDGKYVWMNAIIYDYKEQLSGGHSDDSALTVSEDYGWGWMADKGVDFIQTDWTMMLVDYLKRTDKYYK